MNSKREIGKIAFRKELVPKNPRKTTTSHVRTEVTIRNGLRPDGAVRAAKLKIAASTPICIERVCE
jgi:hypothetical protein